MRKRPKKITVTKVTLARNVMAVTRRRGNSKLDKQKVGL